MEQLLVAIAVFFAATTVKTVRDVLSTILVEPTELV
jgi:hypothetical protein